MTRCLTVLLALMAMASGATAADVAAGRKLAATQCALCHGNLGIANLPEAPNLAGQNEIYLTAQLQAFRSGRRPSEVMSVIARPLSDADIDNVVAWFSAITVQVSPPANP